MELKHDHIYRLDLDGRSFANDAPLEHQSYSIRDSAGNTVVSVRGTPNGQDAEIDFRPDTDGTYFISVEGVASDYVYDGGVIRWLNGFGGYRLTISSELAPAIPADDFGDDFADAFDLGSLSDTPAKFIEISGGIQTEHDKDLFAVNLEAGGLYQASILAAASGRGTLANPDLRWDHPSLRTPQDYVRLAGADEGRLFSPIETGVYYVEVDSEGEGERTGDYVLEIREFAPFVDDYLANIYTEGVLPVDGAQSVVALINDAGDLDWFRAELDPETDAPGTGPYVTYEVNYHDVGPAPVGEVSLRAFDEDGRLLAPRDEVTISEARTVFFEASSVGQPSTGSFALSVQAYRDDIGRDPTTARDLPLGTPGETYYMTGEIEDTSDRDWFNVHLEGGRSYLVEGLASPSGEGSLPDVRIRTQFIDQRTETGDYTITFDGGGASNTAGDDVRGLFVAPQTGEYFFEVASQSGVGSYLIGVTENSEADDVTGLADTLVLSPGDAVSGTFEAMGDQDYVRLSLQANRFYQFSVDELQDDYLSRASFRLLDRAGEVVSGYALDPWGMVSSPWLFAPTTSGTYYLEVSAEQDNVTPSLPGIGVWELSLDQRPMDGVIAVNSDLTLGLSRSIPDPFYHLSLQHGHLYEVRVQSSDGTEFDAHDVDIRDRFGDVVDDTAVVGKDTVFSTYRFVAGAEGLHQMRLDADDANVTVHIADLGQRDEPIADGSNSFFSASSSLSEIRHGVIGYDEAELLDRDSWTFGAEAGRIYRFSLNKDQGGILTPFDPTLVNLTVREATGYTEALPLVDGIAEFTAGSDATYVVTVGNLDRFRAEEWDYVLVGQRSEPVGMLDDYRADPDTTGTLAPAPGLDDSILGELERTTDSDWFRVDLVAGRTYRFEAEVGDLSFVYLDSGRFWDVASRPYAPLDVNFDGEGLTVRTLVSGRFHVAVSGAGVETGTYELSARAKDGFDTAPDVDLSGYVFLIEDETEAPLNLSPIFDAEGDLITATVERLPSYGVLRLDSTIINDGAVFDASRLNELTFTPTAVNGGAKTGHGAEQKSATLGMTGALASALPI